MSNSILNTARGVLAFSLIVVNTLAWSAPLLLLAMIKLVAPVDAVRARLDPVLNGIANRWVDCNGAIFRLTLPTHWHVDGVDASLSPNGWYLVSCNHQSWVDILVLQRVLARKVPLLKFFLKQQLVYVPVIGLAWWALDFPFLRRHGKSALARQPELRDQDRQAARRACARFRQVPTSVMSFPEGTRFTAAKHARQSSPYRHLLRPKAGALAMSLEAMGERFESMLDVTIAYGGGAPSFWQFMRGEVSDVLVLVRQVPIPRDLLDGDYGGDVVYRRRLHGWLEALWIAKDAQLERLLSSPGLPQRPASTTA